MNDHCILEFKLPTCTMYVPRNCSNYALVVILACMSKHHYICVYVMIYITYVSYIIPYVFDAVIYCNSHRPHVYTVVEKCLCSLKLDGIVRGWRVIFVFLEFLSPYYPPVQWVICTYCHFNQDYSITVLTHLNLETHFASTWASLSKPHTSKLIAVVYNQYIIWK